jgi:hypothetical protein
MDSDNTCELGDGSSNYPGVDPHLTPLARHGGFSHVNWPLIDSPMIDLGHPVIGSIGCEDDDQHFLERRSISMAMAMRAAMSVRSNWIRT